MKRHNFGILLCSGLLSAGCIAAGAQVESGWKAGVASVAITPREPIWMAGFASRNRPAEGVQTELYVKALALQDGSGKPTVIVTSDLIGFRRELSGIIAERCHKQYGLTRDRLLLNSSHTHSGPVLALRADARTEGQRRTIETYTKQLIDRVVDVVGRSIQDLSLASLEFNQGLAGFAVNRRRSRPGTRGLPGPVDHDVPVLAVRAAGGKLRAVLFGYACHNTTMAAYRIDAEYAGYAQSALQESYPGAVALFLQGCGADANPLPRYHGQDPKLIERSHELATMYGKILASAVDFALREKMRPVAGPLNSVYEYVDLPFQEPPTRQELEALSKGKDADRRAMAERLLRALDRDGKLPDRYPYAIQIFRFGSGLKLIALAGEVVVDYSLRLKAEYGWEDTWVAGYSNDVFAYIPSKRVLFEGGYETTGGPGGPFSPAVEEIIIEKVRTLIRKPGR